MTSGTGSWHQRRVLVTGCTGFLGSWLSARLVREGARVVGLSRTPPGDVFVERVPAGSDVDVVEGDVQDRDLLRETISGRDVDTVFHLAGQPLSSEASRDPAPTFEANVGGTWSLLDAVRMSGRPVRVVMASTDAVYGDDCPTVFTEESPVVGTSPYAVSKICAENVALSYRRHFDVRVAVARSGALYGGGDLAFQRVIPGTIQAVLRNEAPVIRSDGSPVREYLYVEDAVEGYLRLAEALDRPDMEASTFNLSGEQPVSVLGVVRAILSQLDRPDLEPKVLGRPSGTLSRVHTSGARARELLGWRASTSLEAGLERSVRWYRTHVEEVVG